MVVAIAPFSAITAFARTGIDLKIAISIENYFVGVSKDTISVTASSTSVFKDGFLISKKANEGDTPVLLAAGEKLSSSAYSYMIVLEFASTPDVTVTANTFTVSGATVKNKTIVTAGTKTVLSIELAPPTPFYVNSVEIEGLNIAVGESLTVPTVKSVNGEEKYKDLVSIYEFSWYSVDDAETEGILDPFGFDWSDPLDAASVTVDAGNWYDLMITFEPEGIAVFASDCEMVFENVAGYNTTIALDIDAGNGYADIFYVPITYHSNYPGEIADETYTEFAIYGEDYVHSFDEDPFSMEGYSLRGYATSPDSPHSSAGSNFLPNVKKSFEFYAYWDKILDQVTFTLSGYEIGKSVSDISISDGGVEFTPDDGMVGTNKVWNIVEASFDPKKFFEGGMNEADGPKFVNGNFEADKEYWLVIGSTDWEGIEQPYVYPRTTEGYTLDSEYSARYFFAMGEGANAMFKLPKLHAHGTEYKTDADNHWNECACGDKANVAPHADENNDEKCDACGYDMPISAADPDATPEGGNSSATPEADNSDTTPKEDDTDTTSEEDDNDDTSDESGETKKGLSAGVIAGIVAGSVAVGGAGGFALFWFAIKKKSFADLIAVFKKK